MPKYTKDFNKKPAYAKAPAGKLIQGVGFLILILFLISGCQNNDASNINGIDTEINDEGSMPASNFQNESVTTSGIETEEVVEEEQIIPPESLNLAIPFQAQAPFANWDQPYQDACEEASLILAVAYLDGRTEFSAAEMDTEVLDMVAWQEAAWGGHYDLTAAETAELLEEYYGGEYEAEVLYDWTWDEIKSALAEGHPVVLPMAGQQLGNPYFTPPGPVYHMLVVKGYDANGVITNDVGIAQGADYRYSYDTLAAACHEINEENINWGRKAAIVVK